MVDLGMPTLIELPELEDCAALCRELGLQFLELNMDLPQYQVSAIDPTRFQAAAEAYGLYYTIHLSESLNVCAFDPLVAEAYRRTVKLTIHLAKRLHIPVLNMHLSPGVYFTLPNRRVYVFEEYQDCYLQSLRIFRDECETAIGQADLKTCVENTTGYTAFQQQALAMLLESHAFALTLDIGHSHRTACRDEPFLLEHSKRLHHFHLHDAVGQWDHLPLGTGEINLKKYLALANHPGNRAVLETKSVDGLRQSVTWLQAQHLF